MSEKDIFEEIQAERVYQVKRWGTKADDEINTPMDWVGYIAHYSSNWMSGGFRPYPRESLLAFRKSMIKVAALAVAAIGYTDRVLSGEIKRPDVLKD